MICYEMLSFLKNSFHLSFSIQDSLGKNSTQLLRHCVRLLVLVSTDLVAVRLSGIQFSSSCFIRFKPLHIINFFLIILTSKYRCLYSACQLLKFVSLLYLCILADHFSFADCKFYMWHDFLYA